MATLQDWITTLDNYHRHGYAPGDCGRALLANDLFGFLARADDGTVANILPITRYVYNQMDRRAWGSYEKVDAWLKQKREEHESLREQIDEMKR